MRSPKVPTFRLTFPLTEVDRWTSRYAYADDDEVIAIGAEAGGRGWYTLPELKAITTWKTTRSKRLVLLNDASAVKDATRLALATSDERLRIGVLTLLQGVEMPTVRIPLNPISRSGVSDHPPSEAAERPTRGLGFSP